MNNSKFKYILRFCIQPNHFEKERFEDLVEFCKQAHIDDVMFFTDCEELNQGHPTKDEISDWMVIINWAKKKLQEYDITTSINPWTTLNHADRGRQLKQGQDFNLMVDVEGNRAALCACPMGENFGDYLSHIYAHFAEITPDLIWVEDDFRFHNHSPLMWGGCFCDEHMKEYSKRAEENLTRKEFIRGILQPGKPHPYRKIWLDTARDNMLNLAKKVGDSVHEVNKDVKVGLMSSVPSVHCTEGRDWTGILSNLAGNTPLVNRPHLPSYQEVSPQSYFWYFNTISMQTKAMVPKETIIYPEVENSPRTLFSKSRTFTNFQIETSLLLGAQGITMNLFNVMGNGINMEEKYQDSLGNIKDFLEEMAKLDIHNADMDGIKVMYSPLSSYTKHTDKGVSMKELEPSENFWAGILSSYGIANCYCDNDNLCNEVVAISGQYFRNLTQIQIEKLLKNNFILLDGEAAFTLFDMGYGQLAQIKNMKWYSQYSGYQSYDEVANGKTYCGIKQARTTLQRAVGGFYDIEYGNDVEIITKAKDPYNNTIGASVVVANKNICILPSKGDSTYYQVHLNCYKQAIFKDIIKNNIIGKPIIYTDKAPYIGVYEYNFAQEKVILLVNASLDDAEGIHIYNLNKNYNQIIEISKYNEELVSNRVTYRDGIIITDMKALEVKALRLI
ncbi:hypothetical protein [Vallitalea sp.]|jgi:hypothetical protein|uniref:hypothetical protein n=1 Tax=Vallitalea sp. TaxID=1882829 RepID=UPI0025E6D096|nr:hypothetical protein [Vallitalea sp.]MCT4688828.1 hypothetical protein [Vallitalea sp.]